MENCYTCTINDFDAINQIHLSRAQIYGVAKTPEYNARYPTLIRSILRNLKQDHSIIGCNDPVTGNLVSYAILWMPHNLPWWFCKHIESIKPATITDFKEDILMPIFRLMDGQMTLGDANDKLQGFFAFPVKSFMGIFRYKGSYEPFNSRNFLLHSIVDRNWMLKTQIEVALLAKPLIPKIKTMGVYELSLNEAGRLAHFANQIHQ
jgi:hypothetical protein